MNCNRNIDLSLTNANTPVAIEYTMEKEGFLVAQQQVENMNSIIGAKDFFSDIKNLVTGQWGSLIFDKFQKAQEVKQSELIDRIIVGNTSITSDMVTNEFIINSAKVIYAVNMLANNDKIEYFANLIRNGYFSNEPIKNDEFEEYLALLNELSYREIFILINYSRKLNLISKNELHSIRDTLMEDMTKIFGVPVGEVADILTKLESKSLLIFSSGHGYTKNDGEYISLITEYCKKFLKRIWGE